MKMAITRYKLYVFNRYYLINTLYDLAQMLVGFLCDLFLWKLVIKYDKSVRACVRRACVRVC